MVCKVDDLELTEFDDGVLGATALLAGPAALVPRYGDDGFGRRLRDYWHELDLQRADRDAPHRIGLDLVERLGSGVELTVARDGVLEPGGERGRGLNALLQMPVQDAHGVALGRVLDVRLERETVEPGERLRVVGLVVGRGRPGSYFGYDRKPDMGPWLVSRVVRALHRHSKYVALADLAELDWEAGVIRVDPDAMQELKGV
jgi:hypothetical protein